ncbi:hypothetical protein DSL72_009378 [Monilinia vaccinii-corymbosi]|uniref:Zn(2)-C6 fungal-type domain-containing protein n=1 Tax=Monilinia vaccinii-corymbosi TaxID=61207 RepID=A0A8A3PQX0_9HELO|nr:hypothetical protein DSL72_009378 [Monilinia vaccinii-corymbosi]
MPPFTSFASFTITQPFLGAPLQFQPALGSKELEELIDLHVAGNACKQDKLSAVTIDFYNHATVDINTGSLVRRYDVMPRSFKESPSQSHSSGLSPPIFTPSPASSATLTDSAHGSISTPPSRVRGSRVSKKSKKDTKKPAEVRLPCFTILTKDGVDVTNYTSRGTKTKEQREHAHLMRIIKACDECKRKKIRCDPSHRRASKADISRISASSKPSPPSQSDPSPAASTPSSSRETTQWSEKSSPPVDSFAMEDFVLFPEDDLNQWNLEMSTPGFSTQYSDFSMTNYDTFPDFATSFSTANDNLSFDFPSFNQSSSFTTQPFNDSSHLSNYYNTQSMAGVDVNSQYISPTQPQSDLDFFDSFGNLQNFSPTHTQQAHPQSVASEDPGKNDSFVHAPVSRSQPYNFPSVSPASKKIIAHTKNATALQDFSTTFTFSPTDSRHQPLAPDYGFASTGLDGAYNHTPGPVADSAAELSPHSQNPQSESSGRDVEFAIMTTVSRRRCGEQKKHHVLLERECRRIEDYGLDLVNAFLSGNGEPHVPGASTGQIVSSLGMFRAGDGLPMDAGSYRSEASSRSPVLEEMSWSFESTLSSLATPRPKVLESTVENGQGEGVQNGVKPRERSGALARPSPSMTTDTSHGHAVRLFGDHISSRLTSFATNSSGHQQLSTGTGLAITHLAMSSSMSSPRSRFVVDTPPHVTSGMDRTGVIVAPDSIRALSSPAFVAVDKLDSNISSGFPEEVDSASAKYSGVEVFVSAAQNSPTAPLTSSSLSLNNSVQNSTTIRDGAEPAATTTTATTTATTLGTVSTIAELVLGLAATAALAKHLEAFTAFLALCLVASLCCTSASTLSGANKSAVNTFASPSICNSWSDVRVKMNRQRQRVGVGPPRRETVASTLQNIYTNILLPGI